MKDTVLIYHDKCKSLDGIGSAYMFWKKFGYEIEYFPYNYAEDLPRFKDKHLIFVDCSPKEQDLEFLFSNNKTIKVLDHHIGVNYYLNAARDKYSNFELYFCDNFKSGIGICESYLGLEKSNLTKFIQDYDLFKFEYEDTKYVMNYIFSMNDKFDFESLLKLERSLNTKESLDIIIFEGKIIEGYTQKLVKSISESSFEKNINGTKVKFCNSPQFKNEISEFILSKEADVDFVIVYNFNGTKNACSARSSVSGKNFDCSKFAQKFGGNGHRNAAGFSVAEIKDIWEDCNDK